MRNACQEENREYDRRRSFLRGQGMTELAEAEIEWINKAKRLLKAELKRADVSYEELAKRLTTMGLAETTSSVTNKLSRGSFPATFLLATLKAIGRQNLSLEDV
jgi:hypothetical protein